MPPPPTPRNLPPRPQALPVQLCQRAQNVPQLPPGLYALHQLSRGGGEDDRLLRAGGAGAGDAAGGRRDLTLSRSDPQKGSTMDNPKVAATKCASTAC